MRKKNYYSESLKLFWKNKLAVLSLLILVILTVSAILAPALTPYDPNKQVLADKLLFPSAEHLFGTDEFGRDILTRCLYGCRVSLSVGLVSQLIASVIGFTSPPIIYVLRFFLRSRLACAIPLVTNVAFVSPI